MLCGDDVDVEWDERCDTCEGDGDGDMAALTVATRGGGVALNVNADRIGG